MTAPKARLVIVTGAGSGIGRAIAERYARSGAQVIVADIDEAAAEATVGRIEHGGGVAFSHRLDVADPAAWDAFASGVRADHGVPDVLVNNAGILITGTFLEHSADDWERIMGVNLMGAIHGSRVIGAQMVERAQAERAGDTRPRLIAALGPGRPAPGHIVNIASTAAYLPLRSAPAYAVTKAAVLMLSECLRIEFASEGIGVSAICPTVIRTNIARHGSVAGVSDEDELKFVELSASLQDRFAWTSPDKVARAVLRSVAHNWAIVPVNPDAWLIYFLSRLSPALVRAGARVASFERAQIGADRLFPWLVRDGSTADERVAA